MYPVLFKIGPLTIYSLGVLWAVAAFVGAWVLRLELRRFGHNPDLAASVVTAGAIGGLIGARLLFIFEEWQSFTHGPFDFLLSGAGFSWYGGFVGGALTAARVFKKHKVPLLRAADMVAPALALSYGLGRIGCFLAGDATWGKVSNVPWTMAFPKAVAGWADPVTGVPYPPGTRVHPTQLYELLQSLIVFFILWSLRKKDFPRGTMFGIYLVLAGLMRFIIEFWRANPIVALGMTEYQWISQTLIILGAGLLFYQWGTGPQRKKLSSC